MTLSDLSDYGLERMTGTEVEAFLAAQRVGTLGLRGDDGPYLLPMSYGYDPEAGLYFTYLVSGDSRKQRLTEGGGTARFLVYSAESMFQWRSVSLSGTLREVPEAQWGNVEDVLDDTWQPEILASATAGNGVAVYEFEVDSRVGVRHTSLAPESQE